MDCSVNLSVHQVMVMVVLVMVIMVVMMVIMVMMVKVVTGDDTSGNIVFLLCELNSLLEK